MVDRSETVWKYKKGILHRAEFGEVQVSLNDTVTLDGFSSASALMAAKLFKKTDGTEMTSTVALNVITVTGAGTNIECIYMAYGYKA